MRAWLGSDSRAVPELCVVMRRVATAVLSAHARSAAPRTLAPCVSAIPLPVQLASPPTQAQAQAQQRSFHASPVVERFRKFGRGMRYKMPLSPKRANRRFYKGKGGTSEGRHTRKGRYVMDPDKMLTLEVPDLSGFELKPYVSRFTPKVKTAPPTAQGQLE